MTKIKSKTILITGGASGIGKILCRLSLEKQAKQVIFFDINAEGIKKTEEEFAGLGEIKGYKVDVSNADELRNTVEQVKSEFRFIDILINCAGVAKGKFFHENTHNDIDWIMKINTLAPMYLSNLLLPDMIEKNTGHICNIASLAGLLSNPKMAIYAASKWAVIGWSDSIRIEMKQLKKDVKISTIMPYYTATGMFDGVKSLLPILKPEKVTRKIMRSIEKNRVFLGMPFSYNFCRLCEGIFPVRLFDIIIGKWLGVYKTMDEFKGRG
ncbi:MAG: SDR family oxidoreductase [Bacteroidales bacterium]|jgi:short-subunit dehydrogenase|nr:SDR family oxidoreductase [Bacteroidales bacterium]